MISIHLDATNLLLAIAFVRVRTCIEKRAQTELRNIDRRLQAFTRESDCKYKLKPVQPAPDPATVEQDLINKTIMDAIGMLQEGYPPSFVEDFSNAKLRLFYESGSRGGVKS